MKKSMIFVVLLSILYSCSQKIGYVDNGEIINTYQQKIDIEKKFHDKEQELRKKADSVVKDFQKEVQSKQKEAAKASPARTQQIMGELQQKQQYLQQQMQIEQEAIQQEFQTEIDSVISKIKTYVNNYGKNNNYDYILGTSDASSTVMYGSESNDLTKKIIEALNAEYKK